MELKWRDMTREIIFKGKKVDNGEWIEGYLFDDGMLGEKRMFINKSFRLSWAETHCL